MNEKTKRILEMRSEEKLYHEISEELNCTVKSVARVCENYGYTYKTIPKPKTKEKKPKHNKIYDEDIKKLNADGKGNREIAEELGISLEKIRSISKRLGLRNNESVRYEQIVKRVIELRHSSVRVEDIAIKLNVSIRTVTHICSKYHVCYSDIEDAWKAEVEELRKAGYDYTEVAEKLGVDREEVEKYCQYHNLKYQDLGNENRHAYKGGGLNKGKTSVDWDKRVREILGGRFELVSWILTDNGEARLKVKCTTCGAEKEISSISLRSRQSNRIVSCGICSHLETEQRHKQEREKREFENWQRDLKRIADKSRKRTQMSFRFCEDCGMVLSSNRVSLCESCSIKHIRQNNRNREHRRRIREHRVFDKTITLEKLYDRDNGVCYLCNRTCDWSDFQIVNGNFIVGGSYPTVEHIKPLCKGGEHSWSNVKLACFACNTKKGTKYYENIALG